VAGPEAALPSEYVWSRGAALLAQARAYEAAGPLGIRYLHADVTAPGVLEGQVFDGVVCNYGLTDIDDLDGLLANVARWLRPGRLQPPDDLDLPELPDGAWTGAGPRRRAAS